MFPGHYFSIALLSVGISAFTVACKQHTLLAPVGEVGGGRLATNTATTTRSQRTQNKSDYKVRAGDTLYSIAWSIHKDYQQLARWNSITAPYTIYAGQRLTLVPKITSQQAEINTLTRPVPTIPLQPKTPPPVVATAPSRPTAGIPQKQAQKSDKPATWHWPATGRLVKTFAHKNPGRKGLDIAGKEGQSVTAAKSGRVVYSGSGLIGYGKLIIIKHNKTYLSAYGHNRKLLVGEGDLVQTGQPIAEMGSTAEQLAMLHFEIRKQGQPVDPLQLLPKRPQK